MVLSTTVCRRIRRKAPCAFLKRTLKQKKPRLSLEKRCDLLVSPPLSAFQPDSHDRQHPNLIKAPSAPALGNAEGRPEFFKD